MKLFSRTLTREQIDWEALYHEHMPRIYNYFRYRVGNDSVAEDLTASTFEKAWRARKSYNQHRAALITWLYTIARNTMVDHFRKESKSKQVELEEDIQDGRDTPEEQAIAQQTLRHLVSLLAEFPLRERDLIAMKYGAGLNNRQIARLTGLSDSNVGTIVHRTVSKLRKQMEKDHE